jgi:hypothetical protein
METDTKFSPFTLQEETISWWNAAIVQNCSFGVIDGAISGQVRCMWGRQEPQELQRMSKGTSCTWYMLRGSSKTAACQGRSTLQVCYNTHLSNVPSLPRTPTSVTNTRQRSRTSSLDGVNWSNTVHWLFPHGIKNAGCVLLVIWWTSVGFFLLKQIDCDSW